MGVRDSVFGIWGLEVGAGRNMTPSVPLEGNKLNIVGVRRNPCRLFPFLLPEYKIQNSSRLPSQIYKFDWGRLIKAGRQETKYKYKIGSRITRIYRIKAGNKIQENKK